MRVFGPLLVALAACGTAPPASIDAPAPPVSAAPEAVASSAPSASPAAPAMRAALRYEAAGNAFPSPLVDGMIGGHPTSLLVDTGATHHVAAAWFARTIAAKLEPVKGGATDHGGRALTLHRLADAGLRVDGWGAVAANPLLVIETGDALRTFGIGGVLAPQELAPEGRVVVLDLKRGAMLDASPAEATRLAEEAFTAAFGAIQLCKHPGEGTRLLVDASIEGLTARLQIDTGATHSSVLARAPAGQRLAARAKGKSTAHAASGARTVPMLSGARLRVGAVETRVDLDVIPSITRSECRPEGYLGMDVLRSCVLVMGRDSATARCAQGG